MGYRADWERYHGIKVPQGWQVHHVIPRSLGGTDIIHNLVACPPKAHVKFHLLDGDKRSANGVWNMRNGHSEDTRRKIGDRPYLTGEDHPLFGVGHNEATRKIMSKSHKGKVLSEEHRKNMSKAHSGSKNHFYGKTHSDETKSKVSMANKRECTCPHCGKHGQEAGMKRWHFNNCKEKSNGNI